MYHIKRQRFLRPAGHRRPSAAGLTAERVPPPPRLWRRLLSRKERAQALELPPGVRSQREGHEGGLARLALQRDHRIPALHEAEAGGIDWGAKALRCQGLTPGGESSKVRIDFGQAVCPVLVSLQRK